MKRILLAFVLVICFGNLLAQPRYKLLTTANGLQNNQVRQIVELPNGQILVATEGMFSLYNGREFVEQPCDLDSVFSLPMFGSHSFLWQGDSLLWLKDFYSLYLYDAKARKFRYDYQGRTNDRKIKAFIHENGDSITKVHFQSIEPHLSKFDSLTTGTSWHNELLQAYIQDRQGGEWFGMQSGGLLYVSPRHPNAQTNKPHIDDTILRMSRFNDHILLLAGKKGIYLYDTDRQQVTSTLETGIINCPDISTDNHGNIWICSQEGLYCYEHLSSESGQLQHYHSGNSTGFLHNHMRFSLPLDEERLLVCQMKHHLGYFYPHQKKFVSLSDKLPALEKYRTIVAACKTEQPNEVIVCTQNGLFILDTKKDEIHQMDAVESLAKYSRKYNCILRDRIGRIWIGTQNGLLVMSKDGIRRISLSDGLSNTCIQSLLEDGNGYVWVGTACGINRINMKGNEVHVLSLGPSDGIPQTEIEERGACIANNDDAYFISKGNIIALRTQLTGNEQKFNQVCIVGLKVSGKEMSLDEKTMHLSYRQNNIDLQFSALNYATPEHTRYRYRLHGIDSNWQQVADGKGLAEVHYHALPPGNYTFEVQAATGDGNWGTLTTKTWIIHPPLWLTWWAKLLYIILCLIIISVLIGLYLRHRKRKMEYENDEKVNHLFELRDEARHQFAQSVSIDPEKITINKEEEMLVTRLMKAIEKNLDNVDYTIDQLAQDAGMSRTDLYRKTQQMLGITPNNFLRNVRIKHAARLLAETDMPVNQVALMVGFQTPRYFSQCFRQMFGVNPIEYRGEDSKM